MTNTELLREKLDNSGYKLTFIAQSLDLSYQGFLNKINNKTDFTAPEIAVLRKLLHLSSEECNAIFFTL